MPEQMYLRDPQTARIGEEILPFDLGYLPEYFKKKAEAECHDTPERRTQGLRQLRELVKNDKHTKNLEFEDDFLIQYLRSRKYDASRSFASIKAFIHLKKKNPAMFTNFRYEKTVQTLTDKVMTILPYRCQDGCTVIYVELDNWRPDRFPFEELKRMLVVMLLQSARDPMTQVNGYKVILDVKSNPLRHLRYITPPNLYLLYHGTQECIPGRFKGIHVVNNSLTFKTAWVILKPFMSEKLKHRVYFHDKKAALMDFFPKSILPVQCGGDLRDMDMTNWLKKVMTPDNLAKMGGCQRIGSIDLS